MDFYALLGESTVYYVKVILQISLIYFVIYFCLDFIKETKGVKVLLGMSFFLIVLWTLSSLLDLEVLSWILSHIWTVIPFSVLVVFQPEMRRVFAEFATVRQFNSQSSFASRKSNDTINTILEVAFHLSKRKIGALIVIEREIGMRTIAETGTILNVPLNAQLLETIFYPNTPLHDGAVLIKEGRILSAGCILPLTKRDEISRSLGTRHRAAIGMSEETDCVIVVVSEETGAVSFAYKGQLVRKTNEERLRRHMTNYLVKGNDREFIKADKDKTEEGK
ncbi:MAG: diadenylate cyclase CdaA [Lentisphaeria bacterium]|nr:diadenylate cyclase CdaA [Lentisphaeria bacterium]